MSDAEERRFAALEARVKELEEAIERTHKRYAQLSRALNSMADYTGYSEFAGERIPDPKETPL